MSKKTLVLSPGCKKVKNKHIPQTRFFFAFFCELSHSEQENQKKKFGKIFSLLTFNIPETQKKNQNFEFFFSISILMILMLINFNFHFTNFEFLFDFVFDDFDFDKFLFSLMHPFFFFTCLPYIDTSKPSTFVYFIIMFCLFIILMPKMWGTIHACLLLARWNMPA